MKISLRTKLWSGFGGLLLILLAVSVLGVVVLTRYSRVLEQLFRENYDSVVYCDDMKRALDQLNARALTVAAVKPIQQSPYAEGDAKTGRGRFSIDVKTGRGRFSISGSGAEADSGKALSDFERNLELELNNATLPGERPATEHLAELWKEYRSAFDHFVALDPAARADAYRTDLLPRYEELKAVTQTIEDMNMSRMVSVDKRVKQTLLQVRNALIILGAGGVLLGIAIVGVIGAGIRRPLLTLSRAAAQIGTGNLDVGDELLPIHSRDEIGGLAEAFNLMAARLREFRRLDHNRLVRTQQTTQLAIDSLPDAVFVIGPEGSVEIANRMALTYFNIRPGSTVAAAGFSWLTELYAEVTVARKPSEPRGYKDSLRLFDHGEERFLLPHAVPMLDAEQRVIGVTVVLADVTRLRHEDELKNGLVSTVAHELRTPLTSIRMAVLLLIDEKFGPLAPRQKQLLTAARQDSDRLYGIIENLLKLARVEAGHTQFQFQSMPAQQIISHALEPMREGFGNSQLRLEEPPVNGLPNVLADPTCISLVMTNLLSNALKFTPAGGTVRIAAEADGDCVAFTVADTGPGVPPEYVCRIFDKFFRIPRKSGPTGAGLGLAISKEIAEAHHGRIEFHPRPGGGSVFRFTLPIAPPRTPSGT